MDINYIDRKSKQILTEKVPAQGYLKLLYYNPFGKLALESFVKRKLLSTYYGKLMNKPKSKNKIKKFILENNININESEKSINQFTSFNDFFYRKLKPKSRKINYGFTSPADGKIIAFQKIQEMDKFFIKGNKFTLLKYLQNTKLVKKYKDGTMIIIRLALNDYHRFHFPTKGIISKNTKIKGDYYSVSPIALKQNLKIFCQNKREYSILKTKKYGDILISEIGATMVGTIIQTYTDNQEVNKADEKGYFAFGGSSILLLTEKNKIRIDKDILQNTINGFETKIQMGERIGINK